MSVAIHHQNISSPIEVGSINGEVILFSTARITLMDIQFNLTNRNDND